MKKRKAIPKSVVDAVLLRSKRRCAICASIGDTSVKVGNIEHIEPYSTLQSNLADNLIFLCANHHAELATGRLTPEDARAAREALYRAIAGDQTFPVPAYSKVFLIRGQNDEHVAKHVIDFLEGLGVTPVSLVDSTSYGSNVLDILQRNSSVQFAVAIIGNPESEARRQANVLFELGYLAGTLGQRRVCVLLKPGEKPAADLLGTLFIEMDRKGKWRTSLAKLLEKSGVATKGQTRRAGGAKRLSPSK